MAKYFFLVLLACLPLGPAFAANTNTSVFTPLDLEKGCEFTQSDAMGGTALCGGYQTYPVHFAEGDLRQMVQFGRVDAPFEPWQSFSEFNRVHTVVEWRLQGSVPIAAILRWFIENPDEAAGHPTKKTEGQVLVISTVGTEQQPTSCVIAYVDARANTDANRLAQRVADRLGPHFTCGKDVPSFHGNRGQFSGNPTALSKQ